MARRRRKAQGKTSDVLIQRHEFNEPGNLVTIEGDAPYVDVTGAFVRFYPSAKMNLDEITQRRLDLYSDGAQVVRVMPRPVVKLHPPNADARKCKSGVMYTPRGRANKWARSLAPHFNRTSELMDLLDEALTHGGL